MRTGLVNNSLHKWLSYPYDTEIDVYNLRTTGSNTVSYDENYDTSGNSARYVDFIVRVNGVINPVTALNDGGDSVVHLTVQNAILNGDVITLSYVPDPPNWITSTPDSVLKAFSNEPVVNNN